MKKMTCNQLGGACEEEFKANSFEEIAEMIRGEEKTDVTRKQAKEMLDDANKFGKQMATALL